MENSHEFDNNIKVSIVVPVYNVKDYLEDCLESICSQTYHKIEIIIVNDGSTDNSIDICKYFAERDSRIKIIDKKNGGLSDARNAGLDVALGKYIYFLDSDDYIDRKTIELLVNVAEAEQVDFISFNGLAFIDDNNPRNIECDVSQMYIRKGTYTDIMTGASFFKSQIKNGDYHPPVQMYFFRHSFIEKYSLKFYKGIIHEDVLYMFFANLLAERVIHIPYSFYHRRMRADSIMGQPITEKNLVSLYIILKQILFHGDLLFKNINIRPAYITGLIEIINQYINYYHTLKAKSEKTKLQYKEIMELLYKKSYLQSIELEKYIKTKYKIQIRCFLQRFNCPIKIKKALKHIYHKIKKDKINSSKVSMVCYELKDTILFEKRLIVLCVPCHGNRGDHAIAYAQYKMLKQYFSEYKIIEIPTVVCEFHPKSIIRYLKTQDIFLVCGGGWIGSLWRHNEVAACNILKHFKNSHIVIMPQTVYYTNDEKGKWELETDKKFFSKLKDLNVFLRDEYSYNFCKKNNIFEEAKSLSLVPDMVASLDMQHLSVKKRSGALICFRNDMECILSSDRKNEVYGKLLKRFLHVNFISTNLPCDPVSLDVREEQLIKIFIQIASAEIVVTDRLHCMLFSAITGTPCIAFDNLTKKVTGVYSWISFCQYINICDINEDFTSKMYQVIQADNTWNPSQLYPYYKKILSIIANN